MTHLDNSLQEGASERYWLGRWFTAARRAGLLAHLSPEEWQTFSAILSFTASDGLRLFTLDQATCASRLGCGAISSAGHLSRGASFNWSPT
jgi:hypothetical protein